MSAFVVTPVAAVVPFDNTSNGFVASDTQAAIEEAANASRGFLTCGFDGSASTGRWLEFYANNPSDNNPFIVMEAGVLEALSLVTSAGSATGTVTIYKNGVSVTTIALAAQKKNATSGLNISLASLDEISVRVTAGTISRPSLYMGIKTL